MRAPRRRVNRLVDARAFHPSDQGLPSAASVVATDRDRRIAPSALLDARRHSPRCCSGKRTLPIHALPGGSHV